DLRTLERSNCAPFVERGPCCCDGRVDIVRGALRDAPKRFAGAGVDGFGEVARRRLVPVTAVIRVATFGKRQRSRSRGIGFHCGSPCRSVAKRPTSALAPIANMNKTISSAYMRG